MKWKPKPNTDLYSVVLKVSQVTDDVAHVVPLYRSLYYDLIEGQVFLCIAFGVGVIFRGIVQVDLDVVWNGGIVEERGFAAVASCPLPL